MIGALLIPTALALSPQGPPPAQPPGKANETVREHVVEFRRDAGAAKLAPHLDNQGRPIARRALAAGRADFDGDGNQDLWFLGAGTGGAELSFQLARVSDLGRFTAWGTLAEAPWADAATFRKSPELDRVVLARPDSDSLFDSSYAPPLPPRDPRTGTWGAAPWLRVGKGAFEVETFDDGADGTDDIVVLLDAGTSGTLVKKLRNGSTTRVASYTLPAPARDLRLVDFDGDRRSDVVVRIPGAGALLLRDTGGATLQLAHAFPYAAITSTFGGDVDGDGHGEIGLVFDAGIVLFRSRPTGLQPVVLATPGGVGRLGEARVLAPEGSAGRGAVVARTADGRGLVMHLLAPTDLFLPGYLLSPPDGWEYAGPGPVGQTMLVADLDADRDRDLLVQMPDRVHWVSMLNSDVTLRPELEGVADLGTVPGKGYVHQVLQLRAPAEALARGLKQIELAVYVEDTLYTGRYIYWTRAILPVDPATGRVNFTLYYQPSKPAFHDMLRDRTTSFRGGLAAGGSVLLSAHMKQLPTPTDMGPQRWQSSLFSHDGGDPHKSALGVKWRYRATPPKPSADAELLPWD